LIAKFRRFLNAVPAFALLEAYEDSGKRAGRAFTAIVEYMRGIVEQAPYSAPAARAIRSASGRVCSTNGQSDILTT
jgi:hypothetical protein